MCEVFQFPLEMFSNVFRDVEESLPHLSIQFAQERYFPHLIGVLCSEDVSRPAKVAVLKFVDE